MDQSCLRPPTLMRFLQCYQARVAVEFNLTGKDAQWASAKTGIRYWSEDVLFKQHPSYHYGCGAGVCAMAAMAISPNGTVLTVAHTAVIQIYEVQTQELVTEL